MSDIRKGVVAVVAMVGISLAIMAVVLAVTEPCTHWRLSGAIYAGIQAGWLGRIIAYG